MSYGAVRAVQGLPPVDVGRSTAPFQGATRTLAVSAPSNVVDTRLAVFERAAALTQPASIEQAILRAARSTPSTARDVDLEALLLHYLEVDAARAIRFATEQLLDARFVATMFRAYAARDPAAAFSALAVIADDELRRNLAFALVDIFQSAEAIERLAAIASQDNAQGFVVTALEQLASLNPVGAIREAERLPNGSLRAETFERIARQWVFLDAAGALSYVGEISDPSLRNRFHAAAVTEWVLTDPDAATAYLQSPAGIRLLSVLRSGDLFSRISGALAIEGPERLSALGDALSGSQLGDTLLGLATNLTREMEWSEELARVEAMPLTGEFQGRAVWVARLYARHDPAAALAWAQSLDPSPVARRVLEQVVQEIGSSDPFAGLDIALANDVEFRLATWRWSELSADDLASIAERLFSGGPRQQGPLEAVMEYWPRRDPAGQWDWLVRHSETVGPNIVKNAAIGFASIGQTLPAQSIYRLPESLREHWVVGFASELARQEPDAGLRWLLELESDPAYDRWATAILHDLLVTTEAIRNDSALNPGAPVLARPAAEILATMRQPPLDLVVSAASFWARTEPMEVARWAPRLPDAEARDFAIVAGIGGWTVNDPAGARRFALGLPPSETRDRALLTQLVQEISSHGSASPAVVSAIGTADEFAAVLRENSSAVTRAFRMLATRDPVAATALLDRYVADREMKGAVQTAIDAARLGGFSFPRELVYLLP